MTRDDAIREATALREALHACPEISGHEVRTRALLMQWLTAHTSMTLHPCGAGFYAAHRESNTHRSAIALRADDDALPLPGGGASHLCGHDGHAAGLCAVALMLEGATLGRNVFLLFQPAEETGQGAQACLSMLEQEHVDEIYGLHNLPGFPLGQITTRRGTFACASRGLSIRLTGRPTHAAYPELGVNPAQAVGELLCALPSLADASRYHGMTLCTPIGTRLGEKAFGSAAADVEIWLTCRSEQDDDLSLLERLIREKAVMLAQMHGLSCAFEVEDPFPATVNDAACADKVLRLCGGVVLPVPMRWSEDFGWYLQRVKGAFFGVGAGECCPGLHTADYEFPDEALPFIIDAWWLLLNGD